MTGIVEKSIINKLKMFYVSGNIDLWTKQQQW